jgi:hypothetical protein
MLIMTAPMTALALAVAILASTAMSNVATAASKSETNKQLQAQLSIQQSMFALQNVQQSLETSERQWLKGIDRHQGAFRVDIDRWALRTCVRSRDVTGRFEGTPLYDEQRQVSRDPDLRHRRLYRTSFFYDCDP